MLEQPRATLLKNLKKKADGDAEVAPVPKKKDKSKADPKAKSTPKATPAPTPSANAETPASGAESSTPRGLGPPPIKKSKGGSAAQDAAEQARADLLAKLSG